MARGIQTRSTTPRASTWLANCRTGRPREAAMASKGAIVITGASTGMAVPSAWRSAGIEYSPA
jgi:hypothetical protein